MDESNELRAYRPIQEESSGVGSLMRLLLPVLVIACAILAFNPELVRRIAPGWPAGPGVIRMIAIPLLFVSAVIGGLASQAKRNAERRAAFAAFAASVGGEVANRPYRVTPSGWEGGLSVDYRIGALPGTMEVDRSGKSAFSFRVKSDVTLKRDVQFQILPGGAATRVLLSKTFLVPVFGLAMKSASNVSEPARIQVIGRIQYLASDPITTGDDLFDRNFLMKSSDPVVGRSFATDPAVRAALTTLRERSRGFQISLECGSSNGPGRLVVRHGGSSGRRPGRDGWRAPRGPRVPREARGHRGGRARGCVAGPMTG